MIITDSFLENRLLGDNDRKELENMVELFELYCPETLSKKIPEANVQQAFVTVKVIDIYETGMEVLSVGSYMDTGSEFLRKANTKIIEIDPVINYSLERYHVLFPEVKFDIIISTSVLEHVDNDENFISLICKHLKPGGVAILTCDFKEDWRKGMPAPATDNQMYTNYDLNVRLRRVIEENGCSLGRNTNWIGVPDFLYQGHVYSFATLMFRKER